MMFLNRKYNQITSFNKGFTILEALLAALLVAAGLVLLFSIVNRSVFIHSEMAGKEIAVVLADETLSRISAGLVNLPEEATGLSGDFSKNYPNYSWEAKLETINGDLLKVNVLVTWELNGKANSYRISTLLHKGSKH